MSPLFRRVWHKRLSVLDGWIFWCVVPVYFGMGEAVF